MNARNGDLWDDLQQLLECDSAESLGARTSDQLHRLGFDKWIYASAMTAVPASLSLIEFPAAWMSHYRRRGYFDVDPVVDHCRQHITPCLWAADPAAKGFGHATRFFPEAVDFGLRVGIGLPTHGPGGSPGLLSVATEDTLQAAICLHQLGDLQLLAAFVHETLIRLASRAAQAQVHLTARELDALRWAAEGKTSWEIGQKLGISERTAIFHINNSARKLGVIGRRQAIARAMSLQLIAI